MVRIESSGYGLEWREEQGMNRAALQQCNYGVYLVSCQKDGKLNGQIANTVCQVTSEPAAVSVCINKQNLTHDFIADGKVFSVSILAEDTPMPFIGRFGFKSGREIDKFEGINYRVGKTLAPIVLDHATSYIDCEVIGAMDVGTHTIFVGRVVDAEMLTDGRPMTYEYYHQVKGGKSPRTAPTFAGTIQEEKKSEKETKAMASYKCIICGYIYDPAEGDSTAGIPAGTAFEDLPDSWVCPVCGAPKTEFEKVA
jgi:flavin reductase (DIM6/NTAB) family NADH-FMN oxidoreductase RutF/rubredoxin